MMMMKKDDVIRRKTDEVIIPNIWGKGTHYSGIMPVSEVKNRVNNSGTVEIGDTLFVNGVPHVECGNCHVHIKKYPIVERGSAMKAEGYKISIGHWQPIEEYYVDANNVLCVRTKMIPIITQVDGCFDCWNRQNKEKQINRINGMDRVVMYPRS